MTSASRSGYGSDAVQVAVVSSALLSVMLVLAWGKYNPPPLGPPVILHRAQNDNGLIEYSSFVVQHPTRVFSDGPQSDTIRHPDSCGSEAQEQDSTLVINGDPKSPRTQSVEYGDPLSTTESSWCNSGGGVDDSKNTIENQPPLKSQPTASLQYRDTNPDPINSGIRPRRIQCHGIHSDSPKVSMATEGGKCFREVAGEAPTSPKVRPEQDVPKPEQPTQVIPPRPPTTPSSRSIMGSAHRRIIPIVPIIPRSLERKAKSQARRLNVAQETLQTETGLFGEKKDEQLEEKLSVVLNQQAPSSTSADTAHKESFNVRSKNVHPCERPS